MAELEPGQTQPRFPRKPLASITKEPPLTQIFFNVTLVLRRWDVVKDIRKVILLEVIRNEFQHYNDPAMTLTFWNFWQTQRANQRYKSSSADKQLIAECLQSFHHLWRLAKLYLADENVYVHPYTSDNYNPFIFSTGSRLIRLSAALRKPRFLTKASSEFFLAANSSEEFKLPLHPKEKLVLLDVGCVIRLVYAYALDNHLMDSIDSEFLLIDDKLLNLAFVPNNEQFIACCLQKRDGKFRLPTCDIAQMVIGSLISTGGCLITPNMVKDLGKIQEYLYMTYKIKY